MNGKPIIAYRKIAGEVYHLPNTSHKGIPNFWSICNRNIESSIALQFAGIKNPNLCKHCALEFQRRGY